jgi:AraC-like DNA-binding protein
MKENSPVKCDFSTTSNPQKNISIELKAVYHLSANKTYDVFRNDAGRSGYIALRTITGSGEVFIKGRNPLKVVTETLLFFKFADISRYFCSDELWNFWWFNFRYEGTLEIPINKVIPLDLVQQELQESMTCLEMLKTGYNHSNILASATFSALISKWVMKLQDKNMQFIPYNQAVRELVCEIKSNMKKPLCVKEMAKKVGLCERRFRQVFKSIMGCQPKKYYENIRNEKAKEYLKSTTFSMVEIGELLGYSSQFHFSKNFSNTNGVSPLIYRKKGGKTVI